MFLNINARFREHWPKLVTYKCFELFHEIQYGGKPNVECVKLLGLMQGIQCHLSSRFWKQGIQLKSKALKRTSKLE